MSLRKLCKCNGCFRLTEEGSKYCIEHKSLEARDREQARMYFNGVEHAAWNELYNSSRWRAMSKRKLIVNPVCKCGKPATEVHHVTPHRGDINLFFNEDNLQSLCSECHRLETQREARERREAQRKAREKLWY